MRNTLTRTQTAVEWWTVDPTRTTVEFEVEHYWGLHTVRGRFRRFDGVYFLGPAGPEIELTLEAGSVDTGNSARDRHLRSAGFFDVDEHPQVRFTSTQVVGLGNGQVRVNGELDVAGTSAHLSFEASVRMIGADLEMEATTTVDQRRFGLNQGPFRNIRPPTKVHVRAHLVRQPD
jgi:polyisoprenoid-binding protein YceI